jgi:DnaK suppressor protein
MTSTSILQPVGHVRPRRSQGAERARRSSERSVRLGRRGLAQRRAQLEARWRDRLERVTSLSLAYHEAAQGLPARLDGVRTEESRRATQLARQAVAERQTLAEIEAALDRLAAGRYGWCEQCGRPIASTLLAARPDARYCGACEREPGQRIA